MLYPSLSIVRLGEKKLLAQQEDWEFLSKYLLVLNQNWHRFLSEQRRKANENNDDMQLEYVENADSLLESIDLNEASDISKVVNSVSSKFFEQEDCPIEKCVRLAQIAAALGASVDEDFQYVTRNGYRTPAEQIIVVDIDHTLDVFVNESWYEEHILGESYFKEFTSCTESEWLQWIQSERSKVLKFIPLQTQRQSVWSRTSIEKACQERGVKNYHFPYASSNFLIEDWDFEQEHWDYWKKCSEEDEDFWGKLFILIIDSPRRHWSGSLSAKILHVAHNGYMKAITSEQATPKWILKFRNLPCLQDTHGWYRKPDELFRRTPETEPK